VGGFVGASTQFQGRMVEGDPRCALVQLADAAITLHAERPERGGPADVGSTVVAVVRPEHVSVRDPGEPTGDPNVFEGRVLSRTFVGAITRYRIQLEGGPVVLAETPNTGARRWEADERVRVSWSARHTVLVAGR